MDGIVLSVTGTAYALGTSNVEGVKSDRIRNEVVSVLNDEPDAIESHSDQLIIDDTVEHDIKSGVGDRVW